MDFKTLFRIVRNILGAADLVRRAWAILSRCWRHKSARRPDSPPRLLLITTRRDPRRREDHLHRLFEVVRDRRLVGDRRERADNRGVERRKRARRSLNVD